MKNELLEARAKIQLLQQMLRNRAEYQGEAELPPVEEAKPFTELVKEIYKIIDGLITEHYREEKTGNDKVAHSN